MCKNQHFLAKKGAKKVHFLKNRFKLARRLVSGPLKRPFFEKVFKQACVFQHCQLVRGDNKGNFAKQTNSIKHSSGLLQNFARALAPAYMVRLYQKDNFMPSQTKNTMDRLG